MEGNGPFPSTLSMLQLASRHCICIVNTFYRKHFVSFALPKELADGCRKALQPARSSSWLGVPPNCGPLLRLTSSLDGVNPCGQRSDPIKTAGQSEQRATVLGGTSSVSDCVGTIESIPPNRDVKRRSHTACVSLCDLSISQSPNLRSSSTMYPHWLQHRRSRSAPSDQISTIEACGRRSRTE